MKNKMDNQDSPVHYEFKYSSEEREWRKATIIICMFVLLREIRPIEPYFTSYLASPPMNYSTEQVNEIIYPIGTYSSLLWSVFMFLMTDYLRYKPIIILDGVTGILTYLLLFGNPSLFVLAIEQFFYGFFYSSSIACNTYLYAKIEDPSRYQKTTGYVRASSLIGRFLSGIISQVTISSMILKTSDLIYVTTATMTVATLWSLFIPKVGRSIYFHRKVIQDEDYDASHENENNADISHTALKCNKEEITEREKLKDVAAHLVTDFKTAYTNKYVLKWSFWWVVSTSGYYFVVTYSQILWQEISERDNSFLLNGAVESMYTLCAAGSSFYISRLKIKWKTVGDTVLALAGLAIALVTTYFYFAYSLASLYIAYVIFGTLYHSMLTISESEIAQHLERDSYALIFGINNFIGLGICGFITYAIVGGNLIQFTTRQQFLFYGMVFGMLGFVFLLLSIKRGVRHLIVR